MTVATVRALTNDKAQYDRFNASGDGVTVDFALPNSPVVDGSQKVYVAGTLKTEVTDYTIDNDLGLVTFVTAPVNAAAIVVNYRHTLISDADIETFLTLDGSDYRAAATCLETMATNQVMVLKAMKLLDVQTDGAKVAAELRARAQQLRASAAEADDATADGWDVIELVTNDFSARERVEKQALRGAI